MNRKLFSLFLGILVVTTILASLNVGSIGNTEETIEVIVKETSSLSDIEQSNLAPEADAKDWTFMTYLDGDNNLEEAAISDLDEMEKGGGTNDDINVIVLIDRIAGYDTTNGDWETGRYYEVSADASMAIDSVLLSDLGEVDMSHPDTLQNFIEYCFVNYPAEKYCLNLWDHGGGIFGACWDDTTGDGECLTLQEIQTAVKEASINYSEHIDVLSFDCCVMSMMEVAYEMRNYCDYFIASEESIPFDGYDYQPIISALIADPSISSLDFSKVIVDAFEATYYDLENTCLSVIDTSLLNSMVPYINALAGNLTMIIEDYNCFYTYYLARGSTRSFFDGPFIDFILFCENVQYYLDYSFINDTTTHLLNLLYDMVVYNWQHDCFNGTANGISIFMPITDYSIPIDAIYYYANGTGSAFTGMDWVSSTEWGEFLRFYYDFSDLLPPADPTFISTGVESSTYVIQENCRQDYMFRASDDGIFEINLLINNGDVDLQICSLISDRMEIIGSSKLVNPDDSINEVYTIYLTKGMHYLLIKCNTQSSYKILIQEAEPTILTMNEELTEFGYSINGDGTGHFIQDSNNYYSLDLVVDLYTFILNNTEFTNFQMDLYYQNWTLMTSIVPITLDENLVFIFNSTYSQTIYINIRGSQEAGYFTLKVIGESSGNQGIPLGLIISLTTMAMLPIVLVTKRKKKKN